MKRSIVVIFICLIFLCANVFAGLGSEPTNREIGAHLAENGPETFTLRTWTVEFTEQGEGFSTKPKNINCPLIIRFWDVTATDSASDTTVNYEASMTECGDFILTVKRK